MITEARQDFIPPGVPGALESMALEMPAVAGHPNRLRFRGVLTVVDAPSDKPPSGSRGHRVLLTGKAVEEAIPSLLGMAVDYTPSLDGHDARAKIGVITSAELEPLSLTPLMAKAVAVGAGASFNPGQAKTEFLSRPTPRPRLAGSRGGGRKLLPHTRVQQLKVSGHLFARDFPEAVRQMQAKGRDELGMSYEIAEVHVADVEAPVWEVTRFTFTGAAVLLKSKAAYQNTWIEVAQDNLQFLAPHSW